MRRLLLVSIVAAVGLGHLGCVALAPAPTPIPKGILDAAEANLARGDQHFDSGDYQGQARGRLLSLSRLPGRGVTAGGALGRPLEQLALRVAPPEDGGHGCSDHG